MYDLRTSGLADAVGLMDPTVITSSHQRCSNFGLTESDLPDFCRIPKPELDERLEVNRALHLHALPVMESLYEQISNTHNMVMLTDSEGLILHALGDNDFLEKADKVALSPGVSWSERHKGTNAVGTALHERRPAVVNGPEHYLRANHFLTCSCAPIVDPHGQVIGALDVSGDHRGFHRHTLALVNMSAQIIGNQLFAEAFPEGIRIHFHARAEFIGTIVEGIVAFTPTGRLLSANRSAQYQLGNVDQCIAGPYLFVAFRFPDVQPHGPLQVCEPRAAQPVLEQWRHSTRTCRVPHTIPDVCLDGVGRFHGDSRYCTARRACPYRCGCPSSQPPSAARAFCEPELSGCG